MGDDSRVLGRAFAPSSSPHRRPAWASHITSDVDRLRADRVFDAERIREAKHGAEPRAEAAASQHRAGIDRSAVIVAIEQREFEVLEGWSDIGCQNQEPYATSLIDETLELDATLDTVLENVGAQLRNDDRQLQATAVAKAQIGRYATYDATRFEDIESLADRESRHARLDRLPIERSREFLDLERVEAPKFMGPLPHPGHRISAFSITPTGSGGKRERSRSG